MRDRQRFQRALDAVPPQREFLSDPGSMDEPPQFGWGKITYSQDAANGNYKITSQVWDSSGTPAWENQVGPPGFADQLAREVDKLTHCVNGDMVWWWYQRRKDGNVEILFRAKDTTIFWAEITGNSVADIPGQNRWTYSWKEKYLTSAGYGTWADVTGGRSGTDTLRNSIEDMNDGLTTEGNGVNVTNLDTDHFTFTIQPIPTGALLRVSEVDYDDIEGGAATAYWCQYENGVDGTCDE